MIWPFILCDFPRYYMCRLWVGTVEKTFFFKYEVQLIADYLTVTKITFADRCSCCVRCRSFPLVFWDRGFESCWEHEYLSLVFMLCCPVSVEAFSTSWSFVQRSPTPCLTRFRNQKKGDTFSQFPWRQRNRFLPRRGKQVHCLQFPASLKFCFFSIHPAICFASQLKYKSVYKVVCISYSVGLLYEVEWTKNYAIECFHGITWYYYNNKIKRMRWARHVACMGVDDECVQNLCWAVWRR
jgi:hypothetical protein